MRRHARPAGMPPQSVTAYLRGGVPDAADARSYFGDGDLHQFAQLNLTSGGELRHERNAIPHRNESLDRLEAGQLDTYIERRLVFRKRSDNLPAQGRCHVVRDKILCAKFTKMRASAARKWMAGMNHECNSIGIDRDRPELLRVGRNESTPSSARLAWRSSGIRLARSAARQARCAAICVGNDPEGAAGRASCIRSPPDSTGRARASSVRAPHLPPRPAAQPCRSAYARNTSPAAVSEPSRNVRSNSDSPNSSLSFRIPGSPRAACATSAAPRVRSCAPLPPPEGLQLLQVHK